MKKIDLHIHTIPSQSDAYFDFDIDKFKDYINKLSLNAIAITNHNLFDLQQYNLINESIQNIDIFPGIEIDLENGHLLLIGGKGNLDDFNSKCAKITAEISNGHEISCNKLAEIFVDLNNYLLIPHYDKRPKVSQNSLESLKDNIIAGEVHSPKKFHRIIKEASSLTPVLFSDIRIATNLDVEKFQGKQTFIKTNANDLSSLDVIKSLLSDKNKVFLTDKESHDFFQVFNNGQELSNGLNVVLGGRSSGKTFFLDKLAKIYNVETKSIKYIRQFDLVKNDENKFNEIVEKEKSSVREKYLKEFKIAVEGVIDIDRHTTDYNIEKYLESLVEFATSEKLHDDFSKAVLFKENPYQLRSDKNLIQVIRSVKSLQDDEIYKETIMKYVTSEQLDALYADLENQYKTESTKKLKKQWVNDLVVDIRRKLEYKTSSPKIEDEDINFFNIKMERKQLSRFSSIAKAVKKEVVINEEPIFDKFKIRAIGTNYNGAQELHNECGKQISFSAAFAKYDSPICFLEELKKIERLEKSELYRYFCKVTYHVLNNYDKKISGGERAEFNLLKALQDARQYEMLLIDEPESSFDNLFLKKSVNKEIKDISKELPVIVVTHNSTVGMLMHPDYILFTQRKIINNKDEYFIFSGSSGDKEFATADGLDSIDSYNTLLDTLEAGEDAYDDRKNLYNSFKRQVL